MRPHRPHWFLMPVVWLWEMLTGILNLTGRMILAILGLSLSIAGLILTFTLIAAPVGIPLTILGVLLMIRSLA
jgi:hypothetical protein